MYTILGIRLDIAYVVLVVSRFASNPTTEYYTVVKDIFRYLYSTIYYELIFTSELTTLRRYIDSD